MSLRPICICISTATGAVIVDSSHGVSCDADHILEVAMEPHASNSCSLDSEAHSLTRPFVTWMAPSPRLNVFSLGRDQKRPPSCNLNDDKEVADDTFETRIPWNRGCRSGDHSIGMLRRWWRRFFGEFNSESWPDRFQCHRRYEGVDSVHGCRGQAGECESDRLQFLAGEGL